MGADDVRVLQELHGHALSALALLPAGGERSRLVMRIALALEDLMNPSAPDPEWAWRTVFRKAQRLYSDALSDPALADASPAHREVLQRCAWSARKAAGSRPLSLVRGSPQQAHQAAG